MNNELFSDLLKKALVSYDQGLATWNRIGLNYKQFSEEAKDLSIHYLNQSLDELNELLKEPFAKNYESIINAYSLLINSQILFIRSSCEITEKLENLENKYQFLKRSIELREEAHLIFNDTGIIEKTFLNSMKLSIMSDKAMSFILSARIQVRKGNIKQGLEFYSQSEQIYTSLLQLYEMETPALIQFQEIILSRIKNKNHSDDEKNIDGVNICGYGLVFEDDFDDIPDLDIYRRCSANLYSIKANQYMIKAQNSVSEHELPVNIVEKIDTAINYIYTAMEFFPDQLNYHQDLFDAYHLKGVLFGCIVPQRANYYYSNCPLAIIRYIGHWYLSAGLRYKSMMCNVCGKDIFECQHYPGQEINGTQVQYTKQGVQMEEISIVDIPRDPRCRISEIQIPKEFFAKLFDKEKSLKNDNTLICHLCDITPSDLDQFPLFMNLSPEIDKMARDKFIEILRLDQIQE